MDEEHHSTGMVSYGCIGVRSKRIQKMVQTGGIIGGGNVFFGNNIT